MILQNPLSSGSLYRLDLETGKVVDEYKVSDDFGVTNFLPDSKFAQTTQQQTFIGHSSNGLFRIDPRLSGTKLVESEFKQYATKADFTSAATTESGRLAVASRKGDIRLFDKLGKMAKTALPALGDAILGIDVSADGRWVLATCKTYLLLIDTLIPESSSSKYAGQSGFDRSFPAAEKPTPRRLTLRPEHVAHMQEVQGGDGVQFTPAKCVPSLSLSSLSLLPVSHAVFVSPHLLTPLARLQVQRCPRRLAREHDRHFDRALHRGLEFPPGQAGQRHQLRAAQVLGRRRRRQLQVWRRPRDRELPSPLRRSAARALSCSSTAHLTSAGRQPCRGRATDAALPHTDRHAARERLRRGEEEAQGCVTFLLPSSTSRSRRRRA